MDRRELPLAQPCHFILPFTVQGAQKTVLI